MLAMSLLAGSGVLFTVPEDDMTFRPHISSSQTGHVLLTALAYVWRMVYPVELSVSSPCLPAVTPSVWSVTFGTIVLVAISTAFFLWRRRHPYLLVGWSWYLVMLAPVLVLIGKGMEFRCDRYTYLPQIGLYLLLAWTSADLSVRLRQRPLVLGGLSMIILAALTFCARAQASYWKDSQTLFQHELAVTENNYIVHTDLGFALREKGQIDEAIRQLQEAIRLKPDCALAHNNLAYAFLGKGQTDAAISQCQEALRLQPGYAGAHNNLGTALADKGHINEAIRQYKEAIRLKPDYALPTATLATPLARKANWTTPSANTRKPSAWTGIVSWPTTTSATPSP